MKRKSWLRKKDPLVSLCFPLLIWFSLVVLCSPASAVDDSVCARVKIEIRQELTLERQGFDAHMRISNALSHITLEDVDVDVVFSDEDGESIFASSDPDDPDALFFIRLDSMENISDVDGAGVVQPSSTADIHWLIIPAPGAGNGVPQGTLYYVGATLTYTIGGEGHVTDVTPDYIFVKPMPEFTLDYFLPTDVYGDDAFTPEIEPPIPFSLGVRVSNNGSGVARDMKINSAQPEIVENEQGLQIGFEITGCEVNGQVAEKSLLVNFGDIEPNRAGIARWIMTCSLSGQFVEFTADYSHSDELGGDLTSLLEAINTHFLVRDVLVDVTGRDGTRDFLGKDNGVYRVYESENVDTEAVDQSTSSTLSGSGDTYTLTTPVTAGFMVVKLMDPQNGQKELREVIRSDGKRIKPQNAWLSKTRNEDQEWEYFFNLFDATSTGSYSVTFGDVPAENNPPVLQFIGDKVVLEGQELSFVVLATDPNGTIPSLAASPLPAMASFTDQGDGIGIFQWTPAAGQAGQYSITFRASDGVLEDTERVAIAVNSIEDTDGDGMSDAWEMEHFGTLDRDGTGDFDGDGISDLDEFINGTDPTLPNNAPSVPMIQTPQAGAEVTVLQPDLTIQNSADPDGDPITYIFELYSDEGITGLVASAYDVSEGVDTTSWTVSAGLNDNGPYFWRVRATDGFSYSLWAYGSFFVNTANDPPGAFQISSPKDNIRVGTITPTVEVNNSLDPDEDGLTYAFQIYSDSGMSNLVASASGIAPGEDGSTSWRVDVPLDDNTWYYWKATVTDEHGATTETPLVTFFVDTLNAAPGAPAISSPAPGSEIALQELDLVVNNGFDPDGDTLSYFFELDRVNTFDSPAKQTSGEISEGTETTTWHVAGLDDNTIYYWRAKASDGASESGWARGSIFVNTANDPPSMPTRKNPGQDSWVNTPTPTLALNPTGDSDRDALVYRFEVYADPSLINPVVQGESNTLGWAVPSPLDDSTWHYWRGRAVDEHGTAGPWTAAAAFFVKDNGVDDPPQIAILEPGEDLSTNDDSVIIRWEDEDPDSNADIALFFDTDAVGEDGTLIAEGLKEDPDGPDDAYPWDITTISEGTYYIYGTIADGISSASAYSPGSITIDRSPPTVQATPPGGTYNVPQSVTLSADEPADIYYTTDGIDPTTASPLYTSPIEIGNDITLKFMAVDVAGNQSGIITMTYIFEITITVDTDAGEPLSGLKVYVFNEDGTYTGKYAITDQDGIAHFSLADFAEGSYYFRADYLGYQFWSDLIEAPTTLSATVTIPHHEVEVTVERLFQGATDPLVDAQVGVHVGASHAYLAASTDENGQVSFVLPEESYYFKVTYLGHYFSSEVIQIPSTLSTTVTIPHHEVEVTVERLFQGATDPLVDAPVGVHVGASHAYLAASTDENGQVSFVLPEEGYYFKVTYLGHYFSSEVIQIPAALSATITIPHHQVGVTVERLFQGTTDPLVNVNVWACESTGASCYLSALTDENGQVSFILPEGSFKFHLYCLGHSFWSEVIQVPATLSATITIPHHQVGVTVERLFQGTTDPLVNVNVWACESTGASCYLSALTDENGQVSFILPEGSFKFHVDCLGHSFWSEVIQVPATLSATVTINQGLAQIHVHRAGVDVVGLNVYLCSASGSYLGRHETTDVGGNVAFYLPPGAYKFRADYQGIRYWTNEETIIADQVNSITLPVGVGYFILTVLKGVSDPLTGINCYVFNEGGSYLGISGSTNTDGQVFFDLLGGMYKFRADYLDYQFWSDLVTVPDTYSAEVFIEHEAVEVTVTTGSGPAEGVKVYLYSGDGTYLGIYEVTDAEGKVSFDLPVGRDFKFRADILGSQYWSDVTTIVAGEVNIIPLQTGGGLFQVTVAKGPGSPMEGIKVYLYNGAGTYLGLNAVTDSSGIVEFNLPGGTYKVRVDHLGYQFWSEETLVMGNTVIDLPILHEHVEIMVQGLFQEVPEPMEGINVYLFKPPSSYLSIYQVTDENGKVTFDLPEKAYKVQVDYLGQQFWSDEFIWQNTPINIPMAEAEITVTGAGFPQEGVNVYLFTASGSYLGLSETTDVDGKVTFHIPAWTYKFRADYQDSQYWTDEEVLTADHVNHVILSVGGGSFTLIVLKGPAEPLSGVNCYVFDEGGSYLGLFGATDTDGQVFFDLADGTYTFRVDQLGYQFWSDLVTVPDALSLEILIEEEAVEVTVTTGCGLVEGVRVYLYSGDGTYLGIYKVTDAEGKVSFNLPVGRDFTFRSDILSSQYWSDVTTISGGGTNSVSIDAGGGFLQVTVAKGPDSPMEGIKVYFFNGAGTYLGLNGVTDSSGMVGFCVPEDTYRVRADYLGYQFWSEDTLVTEDTSIEVLIPHQQVEITVQGLFQGAPEPLEGIEVYLFTPTDSSLDWHEQTDAAGKVFFELPEKAYKVRADYLGQQFWSDLFTWGNPSVNIPMADAEITVTGAGFPQEGVNVYLFTASGSYLGLSEATDAQGKVTFHIPAGAYKFKVDYQDSQYWTPEKALTADQVNPITLSVGGGTFTLTVMKGPAEPLFGVDCYVFDEGGSYLGLFGATNTDGQVFFDLADGTYTFRVDHLGYQFWSDLIEVPSSLSETLPITHQDVTITVEGLYQSPEPIEGVTVYLFTPSGSYLGQHPVTDGSGQVIFDLPDVDYKVRADYLGYQFWSEVFRSQDTTLTIHEGLAEIHVHRAGVDVEGAKVYLFTEGGSYLAWYEYTDALGRAEFLLPDRAYKFRADDSGEQHWSPVVNIQAGEVNSIELDIQ